MTAFDPQRAASESGGTPAFDVNVNVNDSVYYDAGYWNDFDATQQMFNRRISGGTPGLQGHSTSWSTMPPRTTLR